MCSIFFFFSFIIYSLNFNASKKIRLKKVVNCDCGALWWWIYFWSRGVEGKICRGFRIENLRKLFNNRQWIQTNFHWISWILKNLNEFYISFIEYLQSSIEFSMNTKKIERIPWISKNWIHQLKFNPSMDLGGFSGFAKINIVNFFFLKIENCKEILEKSD